MIRNNYRGKAEEARALNTYIKLMRAAESVSSAVHGHLAAEGLSVSQFAVLEALYHLGPLSQAEIAKKILKSTGNITLVTDNLEKRGLAKRERNPEDRRYYTVRLTTEGLKLIQALFPRHAEGITKAMKGLTISEQKSLGNLCRKLGKSINTGKKGEIDE